MPLQLLRHNVLVRLLTQEKAGSIHLPPSLQDEFNVGGPKLYRVLATGPGTVQQPMECSPGDRVLVHSYTSGPAELPDGSAIINLDQVLAVFPHEPV